MAPVAGTASTSLAREVAVRLGERQGTLAANLVNFAGALRAAGLEATPGRVIDAARALAAIEVTVREDVRAALRATFLSDHAQTALFDTLFELYWRGADAPAPALELREAEEAALSPPTESGVPEQRLLAVLPRAAVAPEGDNPEGTAGATDLLTTKDFATYTDEDLAEARRLVRAMAPRLAASLTRRRRIARRGAEIDLRRSMRLATRHGGELVQLLRRRRRVRRLRVVLLCDVSGSMDLYSRQLVQFLFAVQNELRGVSSFVFSTRLHEVTHLLKTRSFDEALARLGREVDAWSGGTSIGRCLAQFERGYARTRVSSRTVVVIISDGWDRGDATELRGAMAGLKRRAHRVLWLNPLLGHPDYRPLARGMATALPYTDDFLPAHNLAALVRVARTLAKTAG